MRNPFKYGDLAKNKDFCNRRAEISRIHNAFIDGQNIILISPRRWGKSSLVDEAIRRYKEDAIVVRMDCFRVRSSDEFTLVLLKSLLKASGSRIQEIVDMGKSLLGDLISSVSFSTEMTGEIKIDIDLPKSKKDPGLILDLAQKMALKKKKRVIVCVDEFQKITDWKKGNDFLEKLRSHWMHHDQVCYCLYGSKRHLMESMFSDKSQPFFRFGELLFLRKIDVKEWKHYIVARFVRSGKQISGDQAVRIVQLAGAHSYYVPYLCRICWFNTAEKVDADVIEQSYEELINDHMDIFHHLTGPLTQYQVNYLKAFTMGVKQFTAKKTLETYDMGTAGNVNRVEQAMEDMEIIDYYTDPPEFADPYFEPLFRRRFLPDS